MIYQRNLFLHLNDRFFPVTTLKVAIILYVIICGCFKIELKNWIIPASQVPAGFGSGGYFPYGFAGVMKGAAICFFGFIGFDVIAAAGEEVENPEKSLPKSICLSLFIVFLAYIGVSSVLTLMVPYYELVSVENILSRIFD